MAIKRPRLLIAVLLVATALGSAGLWFGLHTTSQPVISGPTFPVFYPVFASQEIVTDTKSVSYDPATHVLTVTVEAHGKRVFLSEQQPPAIFNESGVYSFKLNQAHEYDTFSSNIGQVSLTRPDGLNGQTVAWDNTGQGVFILAHGLEELTPDEWQQLFNAMQVVNRPISR